MSKSETPEDQRVQVCSNEPDRRQKLRLFFSADLVGSTAFKAIRVACENNVYDKKRETWSGVFLDFFERFVSEFHEQCRAAEQRIGDIWHTKLPRPLHLDRIEVWKTLGDEILFTDIISPDHAHAHVAGQVMAFYDAIHIIDEEFTRYDLGVKGSVWTAGFPIRNKEVRFCMGEPSYAAVMPDDTKTEADPDTGSNVLIAGTWFHDFLGPEIDSGFRLAKHTSRRRIVVSIDVADVLSTINIPAYPLRIHHLGWRVLKGSYYERPYPIFWLSKGNPSIQVERQREPWEGWPDELAMYFFKHPHENSESLRALIERYRKKNDDILITPYWHPDQIRGCHDEAYAEGIAPIREIRCGWAQGGFKMLPLDELHRVKSTLLNSGKQKVASVDHAKLIIGHEKYSKWLEDTEFVAPFTVPDEVGGGAGSGKWALDRLGLIRGHELQVKIKRFEGKILLTDGLWVPGQYRVFPFSDESQRLLEYIRDEKGLFEWPDVLIDPATGCGHHVMAMSHIPTKIAADINLRAIAYLDINRILNGNKNTFVSVHDIQDGMPVADPKNIGGKVLFMINMPFALAPAERVLPLSADGGETGAKMTFKALEALRKFADENDGNSQIRALVLNYSVGNEKEDRWEIKDKAEELFGKENIRFKLLRGHKMWRVNGKKEQNVPMPVEQIAFKAECKYYVTDFQRPAAREGYETLVQMLKDSDYDVVGYGILDIKINLD